VNVCRLFRLYFSLSNVSECLAMHVRFSSTPGICLAVVS
jgi:hypothetical protein